MPLVAHAYGDRSFVRALHGLRAEREAAFVAKRNVVIAKVVRRLTREVNSRYGSRRIEEFRLRQAIWKGLRAK